MRLNFRILAEQIAGRMNWAKCTVSNAVSNAEKYKQSVGDFGGHKLLLSNEIWTSESTGEQEIWA
jgi:hypothetical protein